MGVGHSIGFPIGRPIGRALGASRRGGPVVPFDPLPRWAADLAAVKAGTKNARSLHIGDSTYIGTPGNGTHYRPNQTKAFANRFVADGVKANDDAVFGMSDFNTAKRLYKDLRFTGNWIMSSAATMGGFMAYSTTVGWALTFTPEVAADTYRIFFWSTGTGATISSVTIQATGGLITAPTFVSAIGQQFGTTGLRYIDVSGAAAAPGNSVTITMTAGTFVYLAAIESWDSASSQVICTNAGWFGSSTPNWIQTGGTLRASLDILANMPDGYYSFVTIRPGINDAGGGNDINTIYKPNLQAMINAIGAKSDIIIEATNPISSTLEIPYNTANAEIAAANGLLFVNCRVDPIMDTYPHAQAAGKMGDTLHPNVAGLDILGQYLYDGVNI